MALFSEEVRARIERDYEFMRERIDMWKKELIVMEFVSMDHPHVAKRLEKLAAMSREELIEELESDYWIFGGSRGADS